MYRPFSRYGKLSLLSTRPCFVPTGHEMSKLAVMYPYSGSVSPFFLVLLWFLCGLTRRAGQAMGVWVVKAVKDESCVIGTLFFAGCLPICSVYSAEHIVAWM